MQTALKSQETCSSIQVRACMLGRPCARYPLASQVAPRGRRRGKPGRAGPRVSIVGLSPSESQGLVLLGH